MGGGITLPAPESNAAEVLFAVAVVKAFYSRYEADSCDPDQQSETSSLPAEGELRDELQAVYNDAIADYETPFEHCRNVAVILYKFSLMSDEEKSEYEHKVLEAIQITEQERLKTKLAQKKPDYERSFGGTEADSKNEKDAAALLRGNAGGSVEDDDSNSILRKPRTTRAQHVRWLRSSSRWKKFQGADCVMYIHCLSREVVSIKPSEYEDEPEAILSASVTETVAVHPAHGLPFCALVDLPAEIDRIIEQTKKTPLILDISPERNVATFYSYKAHLEDVTNLCVPFAKGGKKRQDVVEGCRKTLVRAMKAGAPFVLYLGCAGFEQADWKSKLCKKGIFPVEVFENAGEKLKAPPFNPRYKELFREDELEHGEAILRDGFKVIVLSSFSPLEYNAQLEDALPLGYMQPLFVMPP